MLDISVVCKVVMVIGTPLDYLILCEATRDRGWDGECEGRRGRGYIARSDFYSSLFLYVFPSFLTYTSSSFSLTIPSPPQT